MADIFRHIRFIITTGCLNFKIIVYSRKFIVITEYDKLNLLPLEINRCIPMVKGKLFIFTIFWVVVFTGCSHNRFVNFTLTQAEKIVQMNPDSALCLVRAIKRSDITNKRTQARYALLYSLILDKNYIDETNDSLIHIAVKYYTKSGDIQKKFLSLYYLGRIQANSGQYVRAMLSFMEALPLIDKLNDDYLAGLLFSQISQIYADNYDYANSLKAAESAYEHFSKTDFTAHQHYSLLDMGLAYANKGQIDESMNVLGRVVELAHESGDTILLVSCLSNLALECAEKGDFSKSKKLFYEKAQVFDESLDMRDNACMAYVYIKEGRVDSADYYLNVAWQMVRDEIDSAALFFRSFQIDRVKHNYEPALENLEKSVQIQDNVVRQALQQSIVSAQKDYFHDLSEFTAYKLKAEKRLWAIFFVFLVSLVVVIVLCFYHKLLQKNSEISKYINMTCEIQNTLHSHDTEMAQLVHRLFKDKFELINKLGCTYYERKNTSAEKEAIYNAVKAAIQDIGSNKKTKQDLEGIVDACNNNVMCKLREQIPKMKESDYELLCYIFAGFSYQAISIFTQEKIENIYNKKSRLKSKISNSDSKDKFMFLQMIR